MYAQCWPPARSDPPSPSPQYTVQDFLISCLSFALCWVKSSQLKLFLVTKETATLPSPQGLLISSLGSLPKITSPNFQTENLSQALQDPLQFTTHR